VNNNSSESAAAFRSFHDPQHPLALSNVWDVGSALLTQAAGARAIATTSAGLAWSLGFPDGDALDRALAVEAVARIAGAASVPVTVDIEGGYADTAVGVEETVAAMLDAGAVGINIEDGGRRPEELAAAIAAARKAADRVDVPLFINARTDVFLAGIGAPADRLTETLERAARYLGAGADGIFVPGVIDPKTIATLADGIEAPLNIMVSPGAPSVAELGRLGVARVSLGSGVAQAAYARASRVTAELETTGTYESLTDAADYGMLNAPLAEARAH